jgi:hypothetical protein
MKEERRMRVFENRVLRRIFGSKRDEVKREWRKLHNEELNDMHKNHKISEAKFLCIQLQNFVIYTTLNL